MSVHYTLDCASFAFLTFITASNCRSDSWLIMILCARSVVPKLSLVDAPLWFMRKFLRIHPKKDKKNLKKKWTHIKALSSALHLCRSSVKNILLGTSFLDYDVSIGVLHTILRRTSSYVALQAQNSDMFLFFVFYCQVTNPFVDWNGQMFDRSNLCFPFIFSCCLSLSLDPRHPTGVHRGRTETVWSRD